MNQEELSTFTHSITNYFEQIGSNIPEIATPYLLENNNKRVDDYTGIIGISGTYKGCIYVTAPSVLLKHILLALGEDDTSTDNCCDLIGEISNTLAGNARSYFGSDFMISVPIVIQGSPEKIKLPNGSRSIIIPIQWKAYEAALIVSIDKV